ncbi:hypothetical protein WJX77_004278 [Trebouxia sp. C0004]
MCYLLKPLQAAAKPDLILDLTDASVLKHPEMSKLVHRMCVDLTVYAEISNDEWASIKGFANLVKLQSFAGLPRETSALQLDFPNLAYLSLGGLGTSILSEGLMRLELICNLTTLTYLDFASYPSYVFDTAKGLAEIPASLTRLPKLRELHVHGVNSVSASVSMLTSLQVLSLRQLPSSDVDLSGLKQLTYLRLYGGERSTCHLPHGDFVGLRHLLSEQADCALTNLSDATALTYLELKLVEGLQWPTTLQRLQTLKLAHSTAGSGPFMNLYRHEQDPALPEVYMEAIPSEWQHYSSLTCLELPKLAMQEGMPLWLTTLGQLKELNMPNATFYDFPDRLLQLTSIEVLKLHYFNTHLKGKIAGLASLPALRLLDFGWLGHFDRTDYTLFLTEDSLLGLEELEVALRDRPSKLWRIAYPAQEGRLAAGTMLTFADKSFFNFWACCRAMTLR